MKSSRALESIEWKEQWLTPALLGFLVAIAAGVSYAEDEEVALRTSEMRRLFENEAHAEWDAIKTGVLSSFAIPLEDLVARRDASFWENLKRGWSTSSALIVPLIPLDVEDQGDGQQGTRTGSAPSLVQTISYNPLGNWKASISFIERLTQEDDQPWEGDFIYSFGYTDWRPYTLSLNYANYGGNKFDPEDGQKVSEFTKGSVTLGWKFPIHPSVFRPFAMTESSSMGCNVAYSLTPIWSGLNTNGDQFLKHRLGFGCKYTIWRSLFVSLNLNYFPVREQQQPWDADYSYGFGWSNWRKGTVSVQYNNISGTRFPWRSQPNGTGAFKNGSISVSYSWKL